MQNQKYKFTRKGGALLEVMLAVAIVGMGLVGFAITLQKCIEASSVGYCESRLREALKSRLSEIRVGKAESGIYSYFQDEVSVEQHVKPVELQNAQNIALTGMQEVILTARYSKSGIVPLQTEALVYKP